MSVLSDIAQSCSTVPISLCPVDQMGIWDYHVVTRPPIRLLELAAVSISRFSCGAYQSLFFTYRVDRVVDRVVLDLLHAVLNMNGRHCVDKQ